MELIKQEFPFLFKETFSIKKIPFFLGGSFIPLNILFCNGEFEFPFSEASLRVIGYPADTWLRKLEGFHEMNIYFGFIYDLVFNKDCTGELEMRRKSVLKNLGEFLTNESKFFFLFTAGSYSQGEMAAILDFA
ncbi:MAG: hypothetical protein N0E48_23615 [Candidatus Thiodiazotropha endolucinida]|nr:hypothetical protein [Candidatus Thiodiazotropha taylori]MCW4346319.1 hypothetical protein [Candidatus Thiodiazotropha endolucinida]